MADPAAGKSGFVCTYMFTHPDTVVAYVKHFGKVDGNVSSAKMLSIDSKRDNRDGWFDYLGNRLGIQDKRGRVEVVRVEFDPPLLGYEEVKPHLGMKVDTDSALSTVRPNPSLFRFVSLPQHSQTSPLLLSLIYTSITPPYSDSDSNHDKFWCLTRTTCPGIMILFHGRLLIAHTGEGAYAATLANKHHMPWHIVVSFTFHRAL
ncbi:hypothetical protein BGY98DRAFT_1069539 [Russula aff. rugulosa BPL654]|nr:hypothetical protein BGY98DRAFT_1069539 [Russula aff. rugulosa BPL654]